MILFKIYLSGTLTFIVSLLQIYTDQHIINNEFSIILKSNQSKEFAY